MVQIQNMSKPLPLRLDDKVSLKNAQSHLLTSWPLTPWPRGWEMVRGHLKARCVQPGEDMVPPGEQGADYRTLFRRSCSLSSTKVWQPGNETGNLRVLHRFGRCGRYWFGYSIELWTDIYIYIHTYMHACMHTYIHTYTHTHIYIYNYMYIARERKRERESRYAWGWSI